MSRHAVPPRRAPSPRRTVGTDTAAHLTSLGLALALVLGLVLGACTSDDAPTGGTAAVESDDTIAPPATVATPALPVGTDTPGTEVAVDEPEAADVPVALAVVLRSFGDGWSTLQFVRGGDGEWPELVEVGVDRTAASGVATAVVAGSTITVVAGGVDAAAALAALADAGAATIDVAGTLVYEAPSSRRTPMGAALSGFDVVGVINGLVVVGSGDRNTTAALVARTVAAWEESALLSATALAPLYGADRLVATMGALEPADAYRIAHPGASATRVEAWESAAAVIRPPASPLVSAAGAFGLDPATATGRAVALHASLDDATAAASWIEGLWPSGASYDDPATWADALGAATVTTDGTLVLVDVTPPGETWLAAPLPTAWSAAGTVSPAD